MKKTLLCFAAAVAMMISVPSAAFASDTLVKSSDNPAVVCADDGWMPATAGFLIEDAMLNAAAVADPSIVIDDEKNGSSAEAAEPMSGADIRTVSVNQILSGDEMQIAPMSVSASNIGATRNSSTSGNVGAYAGFDRKATEASCTITLQEKYNGSWRSATNVPVKIYKRTVYNSYSISASKTFTLVKGKVYRAKIGFIDKNSTGTYVKTRYTGAF